MPSPTCKPEILFCDKCHKVAPEDQVVYYEPNSFHNGFYSHQYYSYENIAPPSDGMNACLANVLIYCGNIIEPTAEEYFMWITCPMKE